MENKMIMNKQLVDRLRHDAAVMLKENALFLDGVTIIPKEIEIYYYEKGVFEDGSVHQNELQQNNKNHFYIHRWGTKKTDPYKGGNYPGIDLVVSGTKDVYYSYLIRSAIINKKFIVGPHKVLTGIMAEGRFNEAEVENTLVQIQSSPAQGDVLFSERINLGKGAGESASIELRAVMCDTYFRTSRYPQKEKLVTNHIILSTMSKEEAWAFSKNNLGYIPTQVRKHYEQQ